MLRDVPLRKPAAATGCMRFTPFRDGRSRPFLKQHRTHLRYRASRQGRGITAHQQVCVQPEATVNA